MSISRRLLLKLSTLLLSVTRTGGAGGEETQNDQPFGPEFPKLDSLAVGKWWPRHRPKVANAPPDMKVARDEVIAFALYTVDQARLKLTAQLFPLMPEESRIARLELQKAGRWEEVARTDVVYPGWSAHFRVEDWDDTSDTPYRVRHGEKAIFDGLIRKNPRAQPVIVVANMSCNSHRAPSQRAEIVNHLLQQNPDILFFAGDQTYRHTEHTAGWIEFGLQFRDVIRDRPTITIPDDHDVGHPNLWGENGKRSTLQGNADGGYFYPPAYVNMVQRQQTWHLPDPVDPAPVEQGITVYFTRFRWGGLDLAILEDRKFKSGPAGKIPQQGPRPDHINDPSYNPASIDLPGLELLGDRQLRFLKDWGEDWTDAEMKAVLSQTAFCGAVHLHGREQDRLLADLDCNGWPQSERNRALEEIRRASAIHLCGDQHLAVVVKHGIEKHGDGPYGFTSPALVNTIYGRWWHPLDEKRGPNAVPNSPLPWTGDYLDGLGNRITMLAYANPPDITDEKKRADGFGLVRFDKRGQTITLECWPRFGAVRSGEDVQFPGWPISVRVEESDGREVAGWLPELIFEGSRSPVVQVIEEENSEVLYTCRAQKDRFHPKVYSDGSYTVKIGADKPDQVVLSNLRPAPRDRAGRKVVHLRDEAKPEV